MKETAFPFLVAQAAFLLNAVVYGKTFSLWLGAAWVAGMVFFWVLHKWLNSAVTTTRHQPRKRATS